jgi:hypothetical protein
MIKFLKLAEPYGCFSNFSRYPVVEGGIIYKTTEHYYQSKKFLDTKNRLDVINAETPKEAAAIGRDRNRPLRKDWEQIKDGIMEDALWLKVNKYDFIKELLLSTGDEEIAENSKVDWYWALGADGTGKNMLGKLWVKVRERLKKELEL